jgi:hypothetical protein
MEWKSPVRVFAALFAKYKTGEAVRAPPFKWSRQAALACFCSWKTLRVEETV